MICDEVKIWKGTSIPQVLMCWCISTFLHNETSGRDIVINWSRSPGFCQMELCFFPLWSKTGFSHYWFSVKSLWTFLHALKPFLLNQIIAFADGLTQYIHCHNYIISGQMQDPHNILLIVSTGSSPVTCWWNVASAGAHHTLPIPPLQHILRLFPDILMSVRSQPPFMPRYASNSCRQKAWHQLHIFLYLSIIWK